MKRDIEKWAVSRPSAIGVYVCIYVCTYIPTDRLSVTKVQDNFGCVAPYTWRGYVSVPEASRLSQCSPIHWAARRRRHQGHCLRRSSYLVDGGREIFGPAPESGGGGGGGSGDVVSEVTTDWWRTAVFNVHAPLVVGERTRGSRALSKEFRLRGQVGSLADHIYIICYRGMCFRSEIKKHFSMQ